MTGKNSEKDNFFKFLHTNEEEFSRLQNEAQPIVDYVESQIGGKNYWQVSQNELRSIYATVRLMRPEVMVETGVGPGTTTTAILSALSGTDGKLFSFDLGQKFGEDEKIPVGAVVPEKLKKKWKLLLGDSKKTLPQEIVNIAPIDVFFHDSDHTYEHVTFELETFIKYAADRFLVIVDNYDWSDAPYDFCKKYGLELYSPGDDLCYIFRKI